MRALPRASRWLRPARPTATSLPSAEARRPRARRDAGAPGRARARVPAVTRDMGPREWPASGRHLGSGEVLPDQGLHAVLADQLQLLQFTHAPLLLAREERPSLELPELLFVRLMLG